IMVDYPDEEEEYRIVEMTTSTNMPLVERILSDSEILEMQQMVRKIPVSPYIIRYAMKFTQLTRRDKGDVPDCIKNFVTLGAGPRASQNLILGAKARDVLIGLFFVSCEDVRSV